MLVDPLLSFDTISKDDLNRCLIAWDHKMGPWNRPPFREWFYGLRHNGDLVGVTAAAELVKEPVAGFRRSDAFELGRLCSGRPHLNRLVLRMWREFVFPAICAQHGFTWAISYQDANVHTGNTYRFVGWVMLGRSRSGTDQRSGAIGRDKIIWGWCADKDRREAEIERRRTAA